MAPGMKPPVVVGTALGAAAAFVFYTWRNRARPVGPCPYTPRGSRGLSFPGSRSRKGGARTVVVITGACGNLGRKLAVHLVETLGPAVEVRGVEHPLYCRDPPRGVAMTVGDLGDSCGGWARAFEGADAVVHFSAVNPYPTADWEDARQSMAQSARVLLAAARAEAGRVIIASSNHVMGGYKDDAAHGALLPSDAPRCGTALNDAGAAARSGDAIPYAAAKLAAEETARALAAAFPRTTFLALRIGWCQPGANLPATLSAGGCPAENLLPGAAQTRAAPQTPPDATDGAWFRNMWLSNGDFCDLFTAAILSPTVPEGGFHVANAMSANGGSRWSLDATAALLGVRPKDDAGAAPPR